MTVARTPMPKNEAEGPDRRRLLSASLGAAALGALTPGLAEASVYAAPRSADLFAFRDPTRDAVVIAVALPATGEASFAAPVDLHLADRRWRFGSGVAGAGSDIDTFDGAPTRSGTGRDHGVRLVAVRVSRAHLPDGRTSIWAASRGSDGSRIRVGNPVVSELLAFDPDLARIFHRAHPTQDRLLFSEALAESIARRSPQSFDPVSHGRRLAEALLPDVLTFDADAPQGFTFADWNGRGPQDRVDQVAVTVLAGVVASAPTSAPPRRRFAYASSFPFLATAA